jgi:hypothetical protein
MVRMQDTCLTNRISTTRRSMAALWLTTLTAVTFGFASAAVSQETLLTFQGQVTSVNDDVSLAGNSSLYPNQPFDFTILIDSSQGGTIVDSNGVTQPTTTLSDPAYPGFYENAFYVEFVGGNRIWNPAFASNGAGSANYGGSTTPVYTFPLDPLNPSSVISVTNSPWGALIMAGGQPDAHWFFEIETTAATLDAADPRNWQVGETFDAVNNATLDGQLSEVDGLVTLTGISPVPEPSALALGNLAFAAIALARLSKRHWFFNTDR